MSKLNPTHSEQFVLEFQLKGRKQTGTLKFGHCADAIRYLQPMDWLRMTVTVEAELRDGEKFKMVLFSAVRIERQIKATAALGRARQMMAALN